jgi:hypothetical protein
VPTLEKPINQPEGKNFPGRIGEIIFNPRWKILTEGLIVNQSIKRMNAAFPYIQVFKRDLVRHQQRQFHHLFQRVKVLVSTIQKSDNGYKDTTA